LTPAEDNQATPATQDPGGERPAPAPPAQDAPGRDLRPDPGTARTPAEFTEALRRFWTWAGNPSFRDVARAGNGRPAASTMCRMLAGEDLPTRFQVIDAVIVACGGEEKDRERVRHRVASAHDG
jgi:hypothetical protein